MNRLYESANKGLKRRLNESGFGGTTIYAYGVDVFQGSMSVEQMERAIEEALSNAGIKVAGVLFSDTSWDEDEYF